MAFVFSATKDGKVFWFKSLNELPKIEKNITFHIYPVYHEGSERVNLLRDEIYYRDGKWQSVYYLLNEYLKSEPKEINEKYLYFTGYEGSTNVFLNHRSYLDYALKTLTLKRIKMN